MQRASALLATLTLAILSAACAARPAASPAEPPSFELAPSTPTSPTAQPPGSPIPHSTEPQIAGATGQVAYVGGQDPQIFLLDLATGESRQLTQLTPAHAEPTARGPLAPVVSCGFGPQDLRWSPDGTLLAFAYGGCETVLWLVDLDGRLTRVADGRGPTWSPDGRTLVFAPSIPYCPIPDCGDPPQPGAWNLQVADVAAAAARPLSVDETTSFAGQPWFSPDGSLIAFTARMPDPAAHPELFAATYVIRADGADPRLVARGAWPAGWLPDGRLLLGDERSGELRALDLYTTEATPFGASPGPAVAAPDGTRLLLVTTSPATGENGVELTALDGEVLATIAGYPGSWAPDGRAAVIFEASWSALVVVDRDGAELGRYALDESMSFPSAAWRPGT